MDPTAGFGRGLKEFVDFVGERLMAEDIAVKAYDDNTEQEGNCQGDDEGGKKV